MIEIKEEKKDIYLGPFKVVDIEKMDVKTSLGSEVVKVIYEKIPNEIMPLKAFELLSSPIPVDLTTLQRRRFDYLIPKIMDQMMEIDVRMAEMVPLITRVHETVTDHFERACNYLWTKDDRNWSQGMNFMNNRTIVETHKVILEMEEDPNSHKDEGTSKPTSENKGQDS